MNSSYNVFNSELYIGKIIENGIEGSSVEFIDKRIIIKNLMQMVVGITI